MPSRGKSIGKRMEYGTLRFRSRYAEDATWSGRERPRHGLPCWPMHAAVGDSQGSIAS